MEGSLFSEMDLDPEMIEIERRALERKRQEEAEEEKKEEPVSPEADLPFDKKLYILDGYSVIYRSYFAHITAPLTDKEGKNISAYFGFFSTLFSLMSNYQMDYLAVTMDEKEPTFRHKLYPEYKANRQKAPDDLHAQVQPIKDTLQKMGIAILSRPGYEADDVIASLTKKASAVGIESIMVTGDKDLCQLIGDHVYALRPPKKGENKYTLFSPKEVKEAYGVEPKQIVDYLAILGDASDNVPGIRGLGEKGAVKLLTEYLTFDGIYRHLDSLAPGMRKKLQEGKESGELSRELVRLSFDALDDDFDFSSLDVSKINRLASAQDFEDKGFKQLARRALSGSGITKEELAEEHKEDASHVSILTERERSVLSGVGESITLVSPAALNKKLKEIEDFSGRTISLELLTDGYENSSEIIAFSFASEPKKAYYVPLSSSKYEYISILRSFISEGRLKIVAQDAKFLLKHLWNEEIDPPEVSFDTMLAAWLIDSNANVYSLEDLASRYFSETLMNIADLKDKSQSIGEVDGAILARYLTERADYIFRLYRVLERRLHEKNLVDVFRTYEMPLLRILARMEAVGIHLSEDRMEDIRVKTDERISKLLSSIYDLAGHQFNVNSTMQLGKVLFEERGLPVGKKTQRGYSTDTATLEGLKSTGDPLIALILEYRQLSKLKSTYIDVLPSLMDEKGRIHTTFLQTGTATGRLSSRGPNLQNIPVRTEEGRLIRSAFTPEDGTLFLSADYSQIELVVLAYMTDDPGLTEAFRRGIDVHRYTASIIFSKNIDDVTPQERRISKTINFGIMYGMSAFRLSNELGISRSEAAEFIKTYFERYAGVKNFVEKTNKSASELGYVKTEFGHIREIIGINSANKTEKAAAERVAVNTVIQGTAAEIMKKAMIAIDRRISEEKLSSRLLLQVHDELIFEVPSHEKDALILLVREEMESAVRLSVPLKVSIETAYTWGDMH